MCLIAWEPTSGGCHSSGNEGDVPSPSARMPLHLSEGNICWPRWFKQSFTNGAPAKISKLLRMFGWDKRKWGKSPESDTKPLAHFSDSLILREEPGLSRSRPLNSPSQQPCPIPATSSHPTRLPNTDMPVFLHRSDWRCRKPSPWGVEGRKGRNSQIPTPTPHFLKLCHKFCSGIPFHQSIKRGRNHCGSSEGALLELHLESPSYRGDQQHAPQRRPRGSPGLLLTEVLWVSVSASTPSCKYVLSVWPLFLDCNFVRAGHVSHRIFCLQCQEPYKAWKVFAKWVTNHKKCLEMKELKCCAEIRNTFFKSRIISFLPRNQLWSSKRQTGLWYPRCPYERICQSKLWPVCSAFLCVSSVQTQLPRFPCEGI